jgi:hypothetical protein
VTERKRERERERELESAKKIVQQCKFKFSEALE